MQIQQRIYDVEKLNKFEKSKALTCEAIGISEQQSFFTAEYLSSLAVGKRITTSCREGSM